MTLTTLTREKLLAREPKMFSFEMDGETIYGRELSEVQFSELSAFIEKEQKEGRHSEQRLRRRLIALCMLDAEGGLMFPGKDWELLEKLDVETITTLFENISERCGIEKRFEQTEVERVGN